MSISSLQARNAFVDDMAEVTGDELEDEGDVDEPSVEGAAACDADLACFGGRPRGFGWETVSASVFLRSWAADLYSPSLNLAMVAS